MTRADLIVIGGGFAGLGAATAAAEAGARVIVFEARPTLGGRAGAFVDPATGERVDNGQHVLMGCYHETFRLLRRIGTDGLIDLQADLAVEIVDRDGARSRLVCPPLPAPLHLLAGLLRWGAIDWRDRIAAIRMGRAILSANGTGGTVREWLVRNGQTPRLVELLWEPLAVAALNQPIDTAAANAFAAVLRLMFGGRRSDAAIGLARVPLDDLYARPAHAYVERHGGTVRVKAPARIQTNGGAHRVVVRGETWTAPAVIAAVPWHALEALFADRPEALVPVFDAARATPGSPIVTVNLWLDRDLMPAPFVGLPGRTLQWVFDKRQITGPPASHLSMVSSGAEAVARLTNAELVEIAIADLRSALPEAREAVVRRAVVVRERRATFSVAPGQPPRPAEMTAIPGIFLAGDWIDTGLPATIESAVWSGHRAAAAALAYRAARSA